MCLPSTDSEKYKCALERVKENDTKKLDRILIAELLVEIIKLEV